MGGFRVGGPGGKFFGEKKFFFAWNQLTTCICCYPKSFRKNADDLNFAISVPFLMECTQGGWDKDLGYLGQDKEFCWRKLAHKSLIFLKFALLISPKIFFEKLFLGGFKKIFNFA